MSTGNRSFGGGDTALSYHRIQHQIAPIHRFLRRIEGVDERGLGNGDQRRRLGKRESAGGLVEVHARGGVNAVGQVAIEVGVEIPFQDFLFWIEARQFHGNQHLFDLAAIILLIALFQRDDGIFDHLLRNR